MNSDVEGSIENPLDVIIVGGGLSGMVLARNLSNKKKFYPRKKPIKWKLFEANANLGGRLQNDDSGNGIDLGGAWVWPDSTRMKNLVSSLGMEMFVQPGDENRSYDGATLRIVGGAAEVVKNIVSELSNDDGWDDNVDSAKSNSSFQDTTTLFANGRIETNCPVVACTQTATSGTLSLVAVQLASGQIFHTRHVCLACPPKLINMHIQFQPNLSSRKSRAMSDSNTWMAGVTKVALVYHSFPTKIWKIIQKDANGSMRAGANRPACQCYDASPHNTGADGSLNALTFFTIPSISNSAPDEKLAADCAKQFCETVSPLTMRKLPNIKDQIQAYDEIHVKRWQLEKYISEKSDPKTIAPHPEPIEDLARSAWDGMLLFAATEADLHSPGVMEGACSAAERVTDVLIEMLST